MNPPAAGRGQRAPPKASIPVYATPCTLTSAGHLPPHRPRASHPSRRPCRAPSPAAAPPVASRQSSSCASACRRRRGHHFGLRNRRHWPHPVKSPPHLEHLAGPPSLLLARPRQFTPHSGLQPLGPAQPRRNPGVQAPPPQPQPQLRAPTFGVVPRRLLPLAAAAHARVEAGQARGACGAGGGGGVGAGGPRREALARLAAAALHGLLRPGWRAPSRPGLVSCGCGAALGLPTFREEVGL
jgi:hypothetical protein